jgi:hypothetical protein
MYKNSEMRHIAAILLLLVICNGCSGSKNERELARVSSPDGRFTAVITVKETFGVQLPGPEPAKRTGCWSRLTIEAQGKTVFDSGFKNLGEYQSDPFAMDLAWSDDSKRLVYRCINELLVVGTDGKSREYSIINDNSLISSFKWTANDQLLIVAKGIDQPLDLYGYPNYHGYLANATDIRIISLDMMGHKKELHRQKVDGPTFIFNSPAFLMDEISPFASRVAFSDGKSICVYDPDVGQIIVKAGINGSIEGVWWVDDNHLIVGVGLLSSSNRRLFTVFIWARQSNDATSVLLPQWDGMWDNKDWFRQTTP